MANFDYSIFFTNVIGFESIKQELYMQLDALNNKEKYHALGAKNEKGLVLYGLPGTGKSTMALAFAKAAGSFGYETIVLKKNAADGKFTDSLKEVLDRVKHKKNAVLVLDDVDRFGSKKDEDPFVMIQSMLDDIEDSVFVICTCNDIHSLPASLIRSGRLGHRIQVNPCRGKDAAEIIKYYLRDKKVSKDVDPDEIRRYLDGHTVATLQSVIEDAAVYSAYNNKSEIDTDDLLQSFLRFLHKSPRSCIDDTDIQDIVTHELGHTLVTEVLEPGAVSLVSIKQYESYTKGLTLFDNSEDTYPNVECMKKRIIETLAGKAANEVLYGKTDLGCCGDLLSSFYRCGELISELAMLGFSYQDGKAFDDDHTGLVRDKQIQAVQNLVEKYYQYAKKIIIDNKDLFKKLEAELLVKKVLTFKDIARIKATCKITEPYLI